MPLKFTNPSLKTGFLASAIHKTVIIMRKHIVFFTICSLFGCGCVCGCLGYCCWTDGDIHCFGCCGYLCKGVDFVLLLDTHEKSKGKEVTPMFAFESKSGFQPVVFVCK